MNGTPWTKKELQYLSDNYRCSTAPCIAKYLNRSLSSVYGAASKLRLSKFTYYTTEESQFVKDNYSKLSYTEIGNLLGRTTESVKKHAQDILGVKRKKSDALDIQKRCCKATQFTKGNLPHNTKDDGDIGIRDGYKYLRLSLANWVLLHRYNWEQVHGKIPKGFNLVFKDNNANNCQVENLELVSNADLMRRNTIQRYPAELQRSIKLIGKLKRKISNHEK